MPRFAAGGRPAPSSAGCVWQRGKLKTRIDRSWPTHILKRILECLLVRFCRESFPLAQSLGLRMVPQSQPAQLAASDGLDYAHSAVTVVQAPAASLRGASKNRNAKQFWAQFSWQAARDWPGSRKRRSPLCLRRPAVQKATCVRIANASNLVPVSPVLVGLTCLAMLPCR